MQNDFKRKQTNIFVPNFDTGYNKKTSWKHYLFTFYENAIELLFTVFSQFIFSCFFFFRIVISLPAASMSTEYIVRYIRSSSIIEPISLGHG